MSRGCSSSATVGIGIPEVQFRATVSRLLERGCSIRLERLESPVGLVSALRAGRVDAAVRGTLPSSEVLRELKAAFGLATIMRAAVMSDRMAKPFMLAPVGIDEGRDLSERLELALSTSDYFGRLGWRLATGVLSKGRMEDGERGDTIRTSLEEGEELAAQLVTRGMDARHYSILIEQAVAERDLIIAPDGVSGNLIFRSLHLVGGCEAYGAPVVNMDRVFVDTTRAKADFSDAAMLAAGLAVSLR